MFGVYLGCSKTNFEATESCFLCLRQEPHNTIASSLMRFEGHGVYTFLTVSSCAEQRKYHPPHSVRGSQIRHGGLSKGTWLESGKWGAETHLPHFSFSNAFLLFQCFLLINDKGSLNTEQLNSLSKLHVLPKIAQFRGLHRLRRMMKAEMRPIYVLLLQSMFSCKIIYFTFLK